MCILRKDVVTNSVLPDKPNDHELIILSVQDMVDNIVNKVASARARVDAGHKRDHYSAVFKLEFAPTKMIPLKK